ncbi:putative uncharacterized protein C3orf49 [Anguilla rostrata]|uniref:putative uncharacterized protein C3orf49 n=1 Tax=Anguilla rostrata TaxID=7938 RepID=UPI0030CD1E47
MRRLRKWLGRLLSTLHPSHRHPQWGVSDTRKSAVGGTWSQNTTSAGRKLLWPKLDRGSSRLGGSCKRRLIQKGTLDKTKEDTFDPPGFNAIIQVDMEEAKMQTTPKPNVVPRAQRRSSRRVSVAATPTRHKKVSHRKKCKTFSFRKRKKPVEHRRKQSVLTIVKLQSQIDGLVETMADSSMQLLAKRQAELEHCERMGERILDASKQFQRVTSKGSRRHRWRNACVLCTCCC